MKNASNTTQRGEASATTPCSRIHGPLMFAGCDQHEHRSRTDLSCSKIRRVADGKALTPQEVWEVLCENDELRRAPKTPTNPTNSDLHDEN